MSLPIAAHLSSTFEFGAMFHDCLIADDQGNPPFSPFLGALWKFFKYHLTDLALVIVSGLHTMKNKFGLDTDRETRLILKLPPLRCVIHHQCVCPLFSVFLFFHTLTHNIFTFTHPKNNLVSQFLITNLRWCHSPFGISNFHTLQSPNTILFFHTLHSAFFPPLHRLQPPMPSLTFSSFLLTNQK